MPGWSCSGMYARTRVEASGRKAVRVERVEIKWPAARGITTSTTRKRRYATL